MFWMHLHQCLRATAKTFEPSVVIKTDDMAVKAENMAVIVP
jgi:hypothetical protein